MSIQLLKKQAYTELMQINVVKGYLTLDDILASVERTSLPIDEVDRLCEQVISQGLILRDEVPVIKATSGDEEGYQYDKSKLDYNSIYDKVVAIDPSLTRYIEQLKMIVPPQLREEASLLQHAKNGNRFAVERIITMYLKVALRIALWHHEKFGYPLDETIQDANIALIKALEKIKPAENKYSTYAPWWVRQYIGRYTQGVSRTFYQIPVHIKDKLVMVIAIKKKHKCAECHKHNICPTLAQKICSKLSIDLETAIYYLTTLLDPISVEDRIDNDGDELFNDSGLFVHNMLEKLHEENLKSQVATLLLSLKDKEREVLEFRYGLLDGKQRTLEEVGLLLGVTRERVRQIESRAFQRIRHLSCSSKINLVH